MKCSFNFGVRKCGQKSIILHCWQLRDVVRTDHEVPEYSTTVCSWSSRLCPSQEGPSITPVAFAVTLCKPPPPQRDTDSDKSLIASYWVVKTRGHWYYVLGAEVQAMYVALTPNQRCFVTVNDLTVGVGRRSTNGRRSSLDAFMDDLFCAREEFSC